MEYIFVLIPVLLIVIMGWDANESKGVQYFQWVDNKVKRRNIRV